MANSPLLTALGWRDFFQQQLDSDEQENTIPCRVMSVHRGQLLLSDGETEYNLSIAGKTRQQQEQQQITVGDWLLLSNDTKDLVRLLDRFNLVERKAAGTDKSQQLIAANLDTLFIVTSCNEDFNLSRLERYLALAHSADTDPVIVITKKDKCDDPERYKQEAKSLGSDLVVETVNAHDPESISCLQSWCKEGQTVALVGSSGVGKSTVVNALGAAKQLTGAVREADSKGRHTTTHRSLLPLKNGAILLDSPGIRTLFLGQTGVSVGLAATFDDIRELSTQCRFSNCQHDKEPGCAVKKAVEDNVISERRLRNYTKLITEQKNGTTTFTERRKQSKATVTQNKRIKAQNKLKKKQ